MSTTGRRVKIVESSAPQLSTPGNAGSGNSKAFGLCVFVPLALQQYVVRRIRSWERGSVYASPDAEREQELGVRLALGALLLVPRGVKVLDARQHGHRCHLCHHLC
jgi:hypothetical protein